jgi:hypothetical protein
MNDKLNIDLVTNISLTLFLITVIATCGCMLFVENTGE